jgi:hypothetical protein
MKKMLIASTLALSLMSGCGGSGERGDVNSLQEQSVPQPAKIERVNWEGVKELTDGFSIAHDDTHLSFKLQSDNLDNMRTEIIFIDADNNPDTGYNNIVWGIKLGAEYIIAGNNIFKYNGYYWSWSFVSMVDRKLLNENELEVELRRSTIDLSDSFRATAALLDNYWRVYERYDTASYTIDTDDEANDKKVFHMRAGWNLVGINAPLTLEELKEQLGEDNILVINGENSAYIKGAPVRTFEKFEEGKGYYIKLAHDSDLSYVEQTPQNLTIELEKGWNMINPPTEMSLDEIKEQLGDTLLVIRGGDNTGYKPNNPFNTFKKFKEPYGYYIKVSEDTALSF